MNRYNFFPPYSNCAPDRHKIFALHHSSAMFSLISFAPRNNQPTETRTNKIMPPMILWQKHNLAENISGMTSTGSMKIKNKIH